MQNITYHIYLDNPSAHTFTVRLHIPSPVQADQLLSLPAWIPGSYLVREFSKNLIEIHASNANGPLPLSRRDKHTWQLPASNSPVEVEYTIYAWDLSVRMAHFDQNHAYFNGTSTFLKVHGRSEEAHHVCIHPPTDPLCQHWKISTAMTKREGAPDEFGWFVAENYDELIDHPVEIGTFEQLYFEANGTPHEVVLTGKYRLDRERLLRDLKVICEAEIDFFGGVAPMDRYVFQIMVVGSGYGGLEHRASTSLICTRDSLPQNQEEASDQYIKFLGLCSHEYFHTWNVKRIKPAAFVPYDLSVENYTTLLWVFEGWTSYYDDLFLIRNKLLTKEQYLKLLGKTLTRVRKGSGRHKQSLAESSYTAWTKFYRQDENAPNAIVSYYAKGSLAALSLDLNLRLKTEGRVSLDHVMKELWKRFGAKGIGVPENGIEDLATELSGLNLREWFHQNVESTGEIALQEDLLQFGIRLQRRPAISSKELGGTHSSSRREVLSLGVSFGKSPGGAKIRQVFDDGAAQRAGLSAGDVVIAVDGIKATFDNIEQLLFYSGQQQQVLTLHAFRRDELFTREVTLLPSEDYVHHLEWMSEVPTDVAHRRSSWLGIQE